MIPSSLHDKHHNTLLSALPAEELSRVLPLLRPIAMPRNKLLQSAGDHIETIHFLSSGLVSELVSLSDGGSLEVLTIGREGAIGLAALFGSDIAQHEVIVQITGAAWCAPKAQLGQVLERCPAFQSILKESFRSSFMQVSRIAACTGRHTVPQRCASKLVRASMHSGLSSLPLTHELIAHVLGVRRAGITNAMVDLEKGGSIRCMRGSIEILDIDRLRNAACECSECQPQYEMSAQLRYMTSH